MAKGVCLVAADAPGGVRTYVATVAAGLAARHGAARVMRIESRGPWAAASPLVCVAAAARLAAAAAAGRIGVVHLMATERLSLARKGALAVWGRLLGLRVILHHHGAEFPALSARRGPWGRRFEAAALRAPHLHLVLGGPWREALARRGVPAERIRTLPNALPDRPRAPPRRDGGPIRLLFLGELSERKGIGATLEAAARLRDRGLRFHLDVAGDGPEAAPARALAASLGLTEGGGRTVFHGAVDRATAMSLLEAADVLLHPSRHEGLPMALIEALRAGTPALATPVGAIGEALPDGAGVRHVPPDDPEALADAAWALAQAPEARAELGAAGRRWFEARFRLDAHLDALEAHYGWPAEAGETGARAHAAIA